MSRALVLALLAAVGAVAFFALNRGSSSKGVDVVLPDDSSRLSPELREWIDTHVAAVRATPDDGRRHAELAMVYEANLMWNEAARCYARALELDPRQAPWAHHAALVEYYRTNDLAAAITALRSVSERFADYAPALYSYGDLLLQAGELATARAPLEAAAKLAPRVPDAYVALGDLALREERLDDAQARLGTALQLDPGHVTAHYLLGRVLQKLGQNERAARELAFGQEQTKRVTIDPVGEHLIDYVARIDEQLAYVERMLHQRRFQRAEELARRVLSRKADHPLALVDLGIALLEQQRYPDALRALQRSATVDPKRPEAPLNLAACFLAMRKPADALRAADAAIALQPELAHAHFLRSHALYLSGERSASLAAMLRAVELAPDDSQVLASLAELQIKLELFPQARDTTLKLTQMRAGDWRPWADLVKLDLKLGEIAGADEALQQARTRGADAQVVSELSASIAEARHR